MIDSCVEAELAGKIRLGKYYVNRIGYGAMRLTGKGIWGYPEDRGNAVRLLRDAVKLGVNFFDTADSYGPFVSEELIAEALYPYRDVVIATKGGLTRQGPGQWTADCSPQHLRKACEDSLKRLHLDCIDLYQLHTVDPQVPFELSFKTLLDLQQEGKIRYIGLSNIRPEHFRTAMNMGGFVSVQNNYSIFNREHEDMLRLCQLHRVAFIAYFPLGGDGVANETNTIFQAMARRLEVGAAQLALAWQLQHSLGGLPIPGTSSIDHLRENVMSGGIVLDDEDLEVLDSLAGDTT